MVHDKPNNSEKVLFTSQILHLAISAELSGFGDPEEGAAT